MKRLLLLVLLALTVASCMQCPPWGCISAEYEKGYDGKDHMRIESKPTPW